MHLLNEAAAVTMQCWQERYLNHKQGLIRYPQSTVKRLDGYVFEFQRLYICKKLLTIVRIERKEGIENYFLSKNIPFILPKNLD